MTAHVVIGAVDREREQSVTVTFNVEEHKSDLDPGLIFGPANCSVGSQGQSGKQLLQGKEIEFL